MKKGVAPDFFMQPFDGRIPDDEIWNMVNYIKSLRRRSETAAIAEPHEPGRPPPGTPERSARRR